MIRARQGVGLLFSVLILSIIAGCRSNREDAAPSLISAFKGACSTSGRWTEAALAHNQALVSVLEDLKTKDACKPLLSTLAGIQGLNAQINQLLSDSSYSSYRQSEEHLQELLLALSKAEPASKLSELLADAIVREQVALAEKRASYSAVETIKDRDRYANSTLLLSTYMQSVLQQSDGLAACLKQNPGAAVQMATNLLAIGGSFITPIYGAAAGMVGQLMNTAIEYFRHLPNENAIWDLYSAQMPQALSCGLEAMTEHYCDANDAFELLDLQAQAYPRPDLPPQPIWQGLDLFGRRLPVLNQWLLKVKNGMPPMDPDEAQRQNRIWQKVQSVEEAYRNMYAGLSRLRSLYNSAPTKPIKDGIMVRTILGATDALNVGCCGASGDFPTNNFPGGNPFEERSSNGYEYSCWFVLGMNSSCPTYDRQKEDQEEYVKNKLLDKATMDGVFKNWEEQIYREVKAQVDVEFTQIITADPRALIVAAGQSEIDNISPRETVLYLKDFLARMLDETAQGNPQMILLLRETIAVLEEAVRVIDDQDVSVTPLNKVTRISELFDLRRGLQFFSERIGNFIQWDIQARIRRGEFPKDIVEILKASGGDIRRRLLASGVDNLDKVSMDLNAARSLTEANIKVFRERFKGSYSKSVKALEEAARRAGEPETGPNRPNGQTLAKLCTLLLISDQDWPKEVSWEICSKSALESIHRDAQGQKIMIQVGRLKSELEGKPSMQRMCAFHRFLRAGRLAEQTTHVGDPISLSTFIESPYLPLIWGPR